jgi:RNA polymerase sigma-70 factor (ECF subfamily)
MNADREPSLSLTSPQATSLSLLAGARLRDAEAWRRLVRIYSPLVRYWCRRAGVPPQGLDDLVQETFAAVLRGLPTFELRAAGGSFRGWLRTIVGRKLIDAHRTREGSPPAAGGTEANVRLGRVADPLSQPADEESRAIETGLVFRAAVELIRNEFESVTADAFWRTTIDDETPTDVAAALGITVNAVYKAKSRVLRRLREVLAGLEE